MNTWPRQLVVTRPDGGRLAQACPAEEFMVRALAALAPLVPTDATWEVTEVQPRGERAASTPPATQPQ